MFTDDNAEAKPKNNTPAKKEKNVTAEPKEKTKKVFFEKPKNMGVFLIICLLILQLLMSGYQTFLNIQDQVQQARLISSVSKYTATSDQLVTQLLSDYKTAVYNNKDVNNTAKQEVMGTEYNFMAIMLLAKQNSRILELLSQLK